MCRLALEVKRNDVVVRIVRSLILFCVSVEVCALPQIHSSSWRSDTAEIAMESKNTREKVLREH